MNEATIQGHSVLSMPSANSHIEKYLDKKITIYCCRYIYSGTVTSIDAFSVKLRDCGIVYETGEHSTSNWESFEKLPDGYCVALQAIESFGNFK